jgi:hypothetical protein
VDCVPCPVSGYIEMKSWKNWMPQSCRLHHEGTVRRGLAHHVRSLLQHHSFFFLPRPAVILTSFLLFSARRNYLLYCARLCFLGVYLTANITFFKYNNYLREVRCSLHPNLHAPKALEVLSEFYWASDVNLHSTFHLIPRLTLVLDYWDSLLQKTPKKEKEKP